MTNDEKVALIRILGSQYTYDDQTGMNNVIVQDLKTFAFSNQKDLARSACFAYSRLGYFQDSNALLVAVRNRGFIDGEEYYGELAHMVAYAPAHAQADLVSIIKSGKSRYGSEILALIIQDPEMMKKLFPETRKLIQALLEESEPGFSKALGEFSLTEAVRYVTWLHAIANLNSTNIDVKYSDVVLAHLNNEQVDPRKIMAFLSSNEGRALIQNIGQRGPFEKALQRISLYSKQHPHNLIIKDLTQEITSRFNSVKG